MPVDFDTSDPWHPSAIEGRADMMMAKWFCCKCGVRLPIFEEKQFSISAKPACKRCHDYCCLSEKEQAHLQLLEKTRKELIADGYLFISKGDLIFRLDKQIAPTIL